MTTQTIPSRTALVLGATGGFGGHVAAALIRHGWRVRAMVRNPQAAAAKLGARSAIEWVRGDAINATDVAVAADGAQLIVHGVNPPAYRNWKGLVLPMMANTIAAAKASGARILVPGNVYNFAPDSGADIVETAPQQPATRKGAIRVEMEQSLRRAAEEGVRSIVLRAGDFIGPGVEGGGALAWQTARRKGQVRSIKLPGPVEVGHAMAYLPDLGEAAARLADIEGGLAPFEVFHFRGHWLARNDDLAASIRRVSGQPSLPVAGFPWALVAALSPFNETFRELLEMRYLWQKPIGLNGDKLAGVIGPEPHTPLDQAMAASLADIEAAESERPTAIAA